MVLLLIFILHFATLILLLPWLGLFIFVIEYYVSVFVDVVGTDHFLHVFVLTVLTVALVFFSYIEA